MMSRIRVWFDRLRDSPWLLPTLQFIASVMLAQGLLLADRSWPEDWLPPWMVLGVSGVDGGRGMLQAIGSSMITVAALVYSMTLAVLSQTSAQYSSRVVRNFVRDRCNQAALGAFVGIYSYCLVVLRGLDPHHMGPGLALHGAMVLAFLGIGVLIYFIHHVAQSIQVAHILLAIEIDALSVINRMCPESGAPRHAEPGLLQLLSAAASAGVVVHARFSGYVQAIALSDLVGLAREHEVVIVLRRRVGEFVIKGEPLAAILRPTPDSDEEPGAAALAHSIDAAFSHRMQLSVDQAPAFALRQMIDIALKALSPGVNDTTTAVMAIDRLGVLIRRVAGRDIPSRRVVREGRLRVVTANPDFADLLGQAFDQIRQCANGNSAVLTRLAGVFGSLYLAIGLDDRREVIAMHGTVVGELAQASIPVAHDVAGVRRALVWLPG